MKKQLKSRERIQKTYNVHIKYDDIVNLDKEKLVLMHFDTVDLYNKAKKDGFEIACSKGSDKNE